MKNLISNKHKAILGTVAATLLSSNVVHADSDVLGDAYLFAEVGFNRFDVSQLDESSGGFSVGLGYTFNESLGVELSYNDFGEVDVRQNNTVLGEYQATSVSLALLAGGNAGINKYAYGIFGVEYFEDDFTPDSLEADLDDLPSETEVFFGVGLNLSTDAAVPARLTLTSHAQQDLLRLTAGFKFF